jgi:hypothetical protein
MFITGVNDNGDNLFTGEQLSAGSLVRVSTDAPFHGSSNGTIGGRVRLQAAAGDIAVLVSSSFGDLRVI